jgi:hypothetical protein
MAGFVAAWIRGEIAPGLVQPHPLAARRLLEALLHERDTAPDALHVHITHDLTVVALLGLSYPVDEPEFPWPDFLEGCLIRQQGQLELLYRGEVRPIPVPPKELTPDGAVG